jgi:hypothetical protein
MFFLHIGNMDSLRSQVNGNQCLTLVLVVLLGVLIGMWLWKWSRAGMTIEFGGSYCDQSIAHYVDYAYDPESSPTVNVNRASKALPLNWGQNMDLYDDIDHQNTKIGEMDYD